MRLYLRLHSDLSPTHAGCYDKCLYALSASDGVVAARFQTGDIVKCQPLIDDQTGRATSEISKCLFTSRLLQISCGVARTIAMSMRWH